MTERLFAFATQLVIKLTLVALILSGLRKSERTTMKKQLLMGFGLGCFVLTNGSLAAVQLLATGTLTAPTDLSGLNGNLENGLPANTLGGIGSGLAWEGGNRFLALPDRGPNATAYANGAAVDNTTSYIARFHSVTMNLAANSNASATNATPFLLTPTLASTTCFRARAR